MKFWIIAGVMLSVFTPDKAKGSTSQCDKQSFVNKCITRNTTIKIWKRNVQVTLPQPITAPKKRKLTDKGCSDTWSLCCNVSIANTSENISNPEPTHNPAKDLCDLVNGTEFQILPGLFDCLPFYNEMLGKNATNSCAICESVNENWSLQEIARLVECVIQRWYTGKSNFLKDLDDIESLLQQIEVETTEVIYESSYMAMLYKHTGNFSGMEFHANESQISIDGHHNHSKMSFWLPKELALTSSDTFVFLTLQVPNKTFDNDSAVLYERRLFGLSVSKRRVSGLRESVNITLTLNYSAGQNKTPVCVFLDNQNLSTTGCKTELDRSQTSVTCRCDHFTYFGVLLVSSSISPKDQEILSYITTIGCSISLFCLVATAFLLFTTGDIRTEDSKKIHASLVIALILLNLHLLPSEMAAAWSSTGLCLYMAPALHYFLLATLCWMGLEGFHLYLHIVKVFNIYINRYMLKISVVGWGVPALIVSACLILAKQFNVYGHTNKPHSICYITNDTVKYTTSLGVFSLVFLFNTFTFIETARFMFTARTTNLKRGNPSEVKKNSCTVMVLMTLLGLTWGFISISFGKLSTPGLYIFSTLNSLQGFFIFIFIGLSLRKSKGSKALSSSTVNSTNVS
ncbi:adhesion G-protein coupled receptor G5 isoform X2 [Oryzias latipes]|uniref:adhesion G-protein coupled receptor G5 isoform X2 n=1 Tax=Oryzias latipes TaxID=8090 RepID=UPI000CE194BD|nr:adhesion G-protein coupled receptor G5 isoform X2 [Oryzias latipes]